jgi:protein-disulfide isomerase
MVRLVYKHFPLSIHKDSQRSAEAAVCAQEQGRFWTYHDMLFASQQDLSTEALARYAEKIGLDAADFSSCLKSPVPAGRVKNDRLSAEMLGLNATPTFFVNGRLAGGASSLNEIVKEELGQVQRAAYASPHSEQRGRESR